MKVTTISKKISLSLSPLEAYSVLTAQGNKEHTALFETSEAITQAHKQSVIMERAALQITGTGLDVELLALNDNGQELLKCYKARLNDISQVSVIQSTNERCLLSVEPPKPELMEDNRLRQFSSFDCLRILQELLASSSADDNADNDSTSFLMGTFSFDGVDQFESLPEVDKSEEDFKFYVADRLLLQSPNTHSAKVVIKGFGNFAESPVSLGVSLDELIKKLEQTSPNFIRATSNYAPLDSSKVAVNISDDQFSNMVTQAKKYIGSGDVFQVVLARKFSMSCPKPLAGYSYLRELSPSPYMYFINFGGKYLLGASPESALKLDADRQVSLFPIAGTRKRAFKESGEIDFDEDCKTEFELLSDVKENAEHMMLVDLARNDLARVVTNGSRRITQLKRLVRYSKVMHLVSEVTGELKGDLNALTAYRACANMGTLTGAPKIRAMQLIRQFEQQDRGLYGGSVCIMNAKGEFDSAIIIRSAVVSNGMAHVMAGAGVVADSVPELEGLETRNKAGAVLQACQLALIESTKAEAQA